jgi:hypothetical protein
VLKAAGGEHAGPVSVTVRVASKTTVCLPSAPVDVKVDGPFDTMGLGAVVKAGPGDDEETMPPKLKLDNEAVVGVTGVKDARAVLEGTIPPKLNVLVKDVEPNCRLFSLMIDGEAAGAGALRLMTGELMDACDGAS